MQMENFMIFGFRAWQIILSLAGDLFTRFRAEFSIFSENVICKNWFSAKLYMGKVGLKMVTWEQLFGG